MNEKEINNSLLLIIGTNFKDISPLMRENVMIEYNFSPVLYMTVLKILF